MIWNLVPRHKPINQVCLDFFCSTGWTRYKISTSLHYQHFMCYIHKSIYLNAKRLGKEQLKEKRTRMANTRNFYETRIFAMYKACHLTYQLKVSTTIVDQSENQILNPVLFGQLATNAWSRILGWCLARIYLGYSFNCQIKQKFCQLNPFGIQHS